MVGVNHTSCEFICPSVMTPSCSCFIQPNTLHHLCYISILSFSDIVTTNPILACQDIIVVTYENSRSLYVSPWFSICFQNKLLFSSWLKTETIVTLYCIIFQVINLIINELFCNLHHVDIHLLILRHQPNPSILMLNLVIYVIQHLICFHLHLMMLIL